ncbi:MAG: hypothetical protein DRR08_17290 [Candidatus Parabeggiatoa sp. nov. 2]|nr:MAG: hypothetical protein B6247_06460 [Beggiatoa sp. 4572_84]RKZ58101.1 MAG: hypothetical protein DRR08_17290 [Gammaproteobacteria bacterium]
MFPKNLKNNSIVEALCEVHFQSDELPEIIIDRLSDGESWRSFSKEWLPVADIPTSIRKSDERFEYQPLVELRDSTEQHRIKIGDNVFSCHLVGNYGSGDYFQQQLVGAFETLFATLKDITISRIMLRYLNALTTDKHYIRDINSLNLEIRVAQQALTGPTNLNYLVKNDNSHQTITRIASAYFVNGEMPENTSIVVDIDVSTPKGYEATTQTEIFQWITKARQFEKEAFFTLVPSGAEKLE